MRIFDELDSDFDANPEIPFAYDDDSSDEGIDAEIDEGKDERKDEEEMNEDDMDLCLLDDLYPPLLPQSISASEPDDEELYSSVLDEILDYYFSDDANSEATIVPDSINDDSQSLSLDEFSAIVAEEHDALPSTPMRINSTLSSDLSDDVTIVLDSGDEYSQCPTPDELSVTLLDALQSISKRIEFMDSPNDGLDDHQCLSLGAPSLVPPEDYG
jgi:hypothetical protein